MNLLIAMFSYTFQVVQGNADTFWKFQRYHLIVEYHGRPALAPPFILFSHLGLVLRRLLRKGAQQKRAHLGEATGRGAARLPWALEGSAAAGGQAGGAPGAGPLVPAEKEVPAAGPSLPFHLLSRDPGTGPGGPGGAAHLLPCPAFLERDLPEPLDQKMVTWEAIQKENYLSKLEKQKRESEEEVLRKTGHRVDFIAKQLGGLREQEKRIRGLESQVNYCTVLLSSMADTLAHSSAHHHSSNFGNGNRQPPDHGGGPGSREHREAGPLPSDT
ncbi:transient receptor potential cation channel subfamily M member 5 [Rhinolophus ferrumequinum]|uniref:Transient receptor potential cation channel subfamily M member 5 n=1 Tax=Rhinolophus ferrumequinum TaxID=59479 RepID=A0A7J7WB08_RHIFE|nr:transient receptor potential cation channel subfamily M member 5 [Rhinolophus ferrumequinum]